MRVLDASFGGISALVASVGRSPVRPIGRCVARILTDRAGSSTNAGSPGAPRPSAGAAGCTTSARCATDTACATPASHGTGPARATVRAARTCSTAPP